LKDLTPRERAVTRALATGLNPAKIADLLGVTVRTVRRHIACTRQKLGFGKDSYLLAAWGRKHLEQLGVVVPELVDHDPPKPPI
jgi:DNA-binding CsgD family transcriptional regulator